MNDTSPEVAEMIAARYAAMSGVERLALAAGMFETARALVLASLPPDATPLERRRHLLQRFYPELVDRVVL
jgi:hypothetical protein